MASELHNEMGLSADVCRDIVKRNEAISHCLLSIATDETWLPAALSQTGFFVSNGQVKKNRPELWRDLVAGETIKFNWCEVTINV